MMTQTIRVTGQNGKEEKQLHTAFAGFSALLLRRMSVGKTCNTMWGTLMLHLKQFVETGKPNPAFS